MIIHESSSECGDYAIATPTLQSYNEQIAGLDDYVSRRHIDFDSRTFFFFVEHKNGLEAIRICIPRFTSLHREQYFPVRPSVKEEDVDLAEQAAQARGYALLEVYGGRYAKIVRARRIEYLIRYQHRVCVCDYPER